MKVIYAQTPLDLEGKTIFLAGPTPRSEDVRSWRPKAIEEFYKAGFDGTILIPELKGGWSQKFAYENQINWELEAMEKADIILFWVPRSLPDMPGFTTNIEFGYWIAKDPSKIRLGIPPSAVKCDYIKFMAKVNDIDCYDNQLELIEFIMEDNKCYK